LSGGIRRHLRPLRRLKPDALLARRYKRYRSLGVFNDR
jgi:acetyl-CoA carboxylase alpha subunit